MRENPSIRSNHGFFVTIAIYLLRLIHGTIALINHQEFSRIGEVMRDKIDEFLQEPLAQKFLFFNEMLTPSLVRLAYWLCLLAIAWTGLGHMFSGGFGHFVEGIVYMATGAILARIVAELIMVLFKLHEKMDEVAANTKHTTVMSADASASAAKRTVVRKTTKKASKKTTASKKKAKTSE